MSTPNNPQPENQTIQVDIRFAIPKDCSDRELLAKLFASPTFKIILAGFDCFAIPIRYDHEKTHLILGDGKEYTVECSNKAEIANPNYYVHAYLTPILHHLLFSRLDDRTISKDEAVDAYDRLSATSAAYYADPSEDMDDAEVWNFFKDLVTLAFYIPQVTRVGASDRNGLSFFFQVTTDSRTYQFPARLTSGSITDAFEVVRMYYLWHLFTVTGQFETIRRIIDDYHQIAKQHVCRLNLGSLKDPISLWAVKTDELTYKVYQADPEAPQNLRMLVKDIRECIRRDDTDEIPEQHEKAYDAYERLAQFLDSKDVWLVTTT